MVSDQSWETIFRYVGAEKHGFKTDGPLFIEASDINKACQGFSATGKKEVRLLCSQLTRESRPEVFVEQGLFLLPVQNGRYCAVQGEGYVDIPEIRGDAQAYPSKLNFEPETSKAGDSKMRHLNFAFASGLLGHFMQDDSLVFTVQGKKRAPGFSFNVGDNRIETRGVQTQVSAGYEGEDKLVLVVAKDPKAGNAIIRQLFYPFRMWSEFTGKEVVTLLFEGREREGKTEFYFWKYEFKNETDYNSIHLSNSGKYCLGRKNDKEKPPLAAERGPAAETSRQKPSSPDSPPQGKDKITLSEAKNRAAEFIGVQFSEIFLPEDLAGMKRDKGLSGKLLEKLIGVPAGPDLHDFVDGELKTTKCRRDGSPQERTIFITQISRDIDKILAETPFESSRLYRKIKRLLLVPICKEGEPHEWKFLPPIHVDLATPQWHEMARQLKDDYHSIAEQLREHIENSEDGFIHTSNGEYIQIRSKDSGPTYHPIRSTMYGREVSNKNHAFYFLPSFMKELQKISPDYPC